MRPIWISSAVYLAMTWIMGHASSLTWLTLDLGAPTPIGAIVHAPWQRQTSLVSLYYWSIAEMS